MKIEYYASNTTMGDTSDEDCGAYRKWAEAQLVAEYPGADVSVINAEGGIWTDNEELRDEIIEFCHRLWDRCDWEF